MIKGFVRSSLFNPTGSATATVTGLDPNDRYSYEVFQFDFSPENFANVNHITVNGINMVTTEPSTQSKKKYSSQSVPGPNLYQFVSFSFCHFLGNSRFFFGNFDQNYEQFSFNNIYFCKIFALFGAVMKNLAKIFFGKSRNSVSKISLASLSFHLVTIFCN
mgnify:CR=1 FL=1